MLSELDDWWLCHSHGMARLISMSVSNPQRPSFHEASLASYTRAVSGAAVPRPLWAHSRGPSGSCKVPVALPQKLAMLLSPRSCRESKSQNQPRSWEQD